MTSSALALTDQENTLRRLLLDVAQHVGSLNGHKVPQLRFTGGWVRDKLLGSESHDIDIGIDSLTGVQFGDHMKHFLNHADSRSKYPAGILGALAKIEANPEKSKHLETVTTKIFGLEIDLVFKIAAIGIIVAVLNQLLIRSGREDQAMMTTLAGLVVVLSMLVQQISDLFVTIKALFAL